MVQACVDRHTLGAAMSVGIGAGRRREWRAGKANSGEIAGGAGWSVPLGADAWFRTRPHTTEVRRHVVPSACCVLLRATIERSAGCSDLDLDIWAGELGRV